MLHDLRVYYLETYNDQFFAPSPPGPSIPSFFALYALMELVFHLPVSVWAVGRLLPGKGSQGGLDGAAELLLLVYGLQTALTTATCMYEAYLWDPTVVSAEQKLVLLGGLYGGYLALGEYFLFSNYLHLDRQQRISHDRYIYLSYLIVLSAFLAENLFLLTDEQRLS